MQYSYISFLKKEDRWACFSFILKLTFLIIIFFYIYDTLKNDQQNFVGFFFNFKSILSLSKLPLLLAPILLTFFNWAAEARKWQILSGKIVRQDFFEAYKGVLSGLSLGFISPQSIGEYAGRIWQVKNEKRAELVGAVFLGSLFQTIVSVVFGAYGIAIFITKSKLEYLVNWNLKDSSKYIVLIASAGALVLLVIIWLKYGQKILSLIKKYFGIINTYTKKELYRVLFFSVVRYLIFMAQFIMVLMYFEINLPVRTLIAGVSCVYAAKTIIPVFNFVSDIGVREFSALLFFNLYQVDVAKIITASLFIWAINILMPTIVGSFLLLRMRLFSK